MSPAKHAIALSAPNAPNPLILVQTVYQIKLCCAVLDLIPDIWYNAIGNPIILHMLAIFLIKSPMSIIIFLHQKFVLRHISI